MGAFPTPPSSSASSPGGAWWDGPGGSSLVNWSSSLSSFTPMSVCNMIFPAHSCSKTTFRTEGIYLPFSLLSAPLLLSPPIILSTSPALSSLSALILRPLRFLFLPFSFFSILHAPYSFSLPALCSLQSPIPPCSLHSLRSLFTFYSLLHSTQIISGKRPGVLRGVSFLHSWSEAAYSLQARLPRKALESLPLQNLGSPLEFSTMKLPFRVTT